MLTSLIYAAIIGIIAGWLAAKISRDHSFGLWGNLAVGIVGSIIGNLVLGLIGLRAFGFIGSIISSTLGAVILLWFIRFFTKKTA